LLEVWRGGFVKAERKIEIDKEARVPQKV